MEKMDLLKKYLDMACHNLLCYSKNYAMSEPKEQFVQEWNEAQEEIELLKEMVKEINVDIPEEKLNWMKEVKIKEFKQPMKYHVGKSHFYSAEYIKNTPLELLKERYLNGVFDRDN